jgi:hypothetical protein
MQRTCHRVGVNAHFSGLEFFLDKLRGALATRSEVSNYNVGIPNNGNTSTENANWAAEERHLLHSHDKYRAADGHNATRGTLQACADVEIGAISIDCKCNTTNCDGPAVEGHGREEGNKGGGA